MARPLISFRARPEDAEELKALAARERKTVSQVTGQLVEDTLAATRARKPENSHAARSRPSHCSQACPGRGCA
jgi:hypothetical protein